MDEPHVCVDDGSESAALTGWIVQRAVIKVSSGFRLHVS